MAWITTAFAQEPPLVVGRSLLPPRPPPDALPMGGWLLYPTIRVYSQYSDNLFQSPVFPLSVLGFGVSPNLVAEWTNGIHTTTFHGNIDRQVYPTANEVNTFDRQVSLTQKYAPLPDLTFRVLGDYTHKTISSALQNSIPNPVNATQTTVLPDGNTLLPNGTIVSPTGEVVNQANPAAVNGATSAANPYDQFTGTFSVDKIFNRGNLTLSSSIARTNYDIQSSQDFMTRSLTENAGVWLGPLFYAYSNGTISTQVVEAKSVSTTSYRVRGGIGTRQFGLFRGQGYFGHQGSHGIGTAGGDIFGGKLTYYPTPAWTLEAAVDETINIAAQAFSSSLALTLPETTPLQIPLSASTRTTATSLHSDYHISRQWLASSQFAYTRIEYIGSSRLDNTWLVDAILKYDIWRNMALTWEYRYTRILSNAPFTSAKSNFGVMSATYKF